MIEKYNPDWSLLTDLYQLTMTAGYVKAQKTEEMATFNLFFRKLPPNYGFCVNAGLERAIAYLLGLKFTGKHIDYLRSLEIFQSRDINGKNFDDFFDYLKSFRFKGTVRGISEGELVFPNEPILEITAPLPQGQIVETFLLQNIGFQTLIASKAARICLATEGEPVLEFGARRAHGPDGSLSASRAAYIGGCTATSNVLAGYKYDIPVKGTHAHSWVMSFDKEIDAHMAYGRTFPNSSVFLIDTTNVLQIGLPAAIQTAKMLANGGYKCRGVRLDSGNLSDLSIETYNELERAGFKDITIVASNDLDEYEIKKLKESGARINAWGVGTRLVTSKDHPALGMVYKLVELDRKPKIKIAGEKTINPGKQNVWRNYIERARFYEPMNDLIGASNEDLFCESIPDELTCMLTKTFVDNGKLRGILPKLREIKEQAKENIESLPERYKKFKMPSKYSVELSLKLKKLKKSMIEKAKI